MQPLYLAAAEQGALPELRRVVVAYGNQIAMEPTLEAVARADLRRRACAATSRPAARPRRAPRLRPRLRADRGHHRGRAARLGGLAAGQEALRKGDWATYGQEQKRIEEALRSLRETR